jgi:hypothetical protein
MTIPQGLYEVITSPRLTLDEKLEAIPRFAWPVMYPDGEHEGLTEPGAITEEDAALICEALKDGRVGEFTHE